jgi:hypothetical protein
MNYGNKTINKDNIDSYTNITISNSGSLTFVDIPSTHVIIFQLNYGVIKIINCPSCTFDVIINTGIINSDMNVNCMTNKGVINYNAGFKNKNIHTNQHDAKSNNNISNNNINNNSTLNNNINNNSTSTLNVQSYVDSTLNNYTKSLITESFIGNDGREISCRINTNKILEITIANCGYIYINDNKIQIEEPEEGSVLSNNIPENISINNSIGNIKLLIQNGNIYINSILRIKLNGVFI